MSRKGNKEVLESSNLSTFESNFLHALDGINTNHEPPVLYHSPDKPGNPGVGSRVLSDADWVKRQQTKAAAAGADWFARAQTPRKDPIVAAIDANEKRKDRLAAAERDQTWLNAMKKRTGADVWRGIQAAGESGYTTGVTTKAYKVEAAVKEMRPMVEALANEIDKLPDKTDADREKKMIAARRGMIAIGKKLKGVSSSSTV